MDDGDKQAIRLVLGGDRDAYGVLMARHFASVYRVAFRITRNEQDAEEVAQEAFLRAYNKLAEFDQRAGFGTWVYRIAVNCSLNLVERRSREASWNAGSLWNEYGSERFSSNGTAGPEDSLLDREAVQVREHAMEQLTPMERTAFVLRHMEERTMAEISEALGVPKNSVKQAVFRAVGKLRRALRAERRRMEPQREEVR